MKKRLLTALVGVIVAVGWMFTAYTPAYSAILAVFAAAGAYELAKVFGADNIVFRILCIALGGGAVLYADYRQYIKIPLFAIIAAAVLVSLIIMVLNFKTLKFEQVACSLFGSVLTGEAMACIIMFRDVYVTFPQRYTKADGIFFILFAFFSSWISDGAALFAGKAFGKHKLAPSISPKKTVEGAIGGVIGNIVFSTALYFVFKYKFNLSQYIGIAEIIAGAAVLSVISVFGDLAASTIKRHHGVKDFGNLLPGHGGVMDRFDSSVFVFAALWAAITTVNSL